MKSPTVQLPEAQFQEFVEAAEEVRREAGSDLYPATEDRFQLALDDLRFQLSIEQKGAVT